MAAKNKGSNAERELIRLFNHNEWMAMRAAGSGSSRFPCPDILAGNVARKLAIECKATKAIKQYISNEQINELRRFSSFFGAEPWIGVRFDNLDWYFLTLEDLQETEGSNFVISIALAKRKGLGFNELIGDFE